MKTIAFILSLCIITTNSCNYKDKVIITSTYIVNPEWKTNDNSVSISKMILKNDSLTIDPAKATYKDLLSKLEEDESFTFYGNVKFNGTEYGERKVYFNKPNGFYWRRPHHIDPNFSVETIGKLDTNTWYMLGGLSTEKTLYYIQINSYDSLIIIRVPASAWTNF